MSAIRRALLFSALTQYAIQIISFISIAILARLLTPAEIGVFAVASSIAFLAIELRALGVGQYLIREKDINDEKIRSATGLMILVSWSLAAIIVVGAPAAANFYNEKALEIIFLFIAGTFLLAPFSSVPFALLTRDMQFQRLFVVKFTSSIIRSGSTIVFVLLGYSYYGLAMGTLAGAIAEFIAINCFRPAKTPWLPSFTGMRGMIRFGLFTSTGNLLQKFAHSIPDLVLGRVATMADVGLFSRGLGLVLFLNRIMVMAVQPVVLPHLAAIKRAEESVADAYLRATILLAAFCLPLFAVINLSAYPMVRALFGDQWDAAVPIASILAIWGLLQSVHSFSSQALMAVEEEKAMFIKELIVFSARLFAVIVASPYGLEAIAWAMVLSGVIELIVNSVVVKKALGLEIRRLLFSLIPTLVVTGACWSTLKLISYNFDFEGNNPWLSLMIIGISMTIVWLMTLWLVKHEAWHFISQLLQKAPPTKSEDVLKGK